MPAITDYTKSKIKGMLETAVTTVVLDIKDSWEKGERGSPYEPNPFRRAFVAEEVLKLRAAGEGLPQAVDNTFASAALYIAREHYTLAEKSYDELGEVSIAAINEIDRQLARFEHAAEEGELRPSLLEMIEAVLVADDGSGEKREVRIRADLFFLDHDGTEFYFEVKSPKPNKGQCLEVMQRLLRFHLIRKQLNPKVRTFFALPYNPYGPTRNDYHWSIPRTYLPFEDVVLIGQEFWQLVGGEGTYTELLKIYQEVGREKAKFIIDSLGFGF